MKNCRSPVTASNEPAQTRLKNNQPRTVKLLLIRIKTLGDQGQLCARADRKAGLLITELGWVVRAL